MIFFFSKGSARLSVTTELDENGGEYVVTIEQADSEVKTFRFSDQAQCAAFLSKMEQELAVEDWVSDSVGLLGGWAGES